ncbi:hypothetical protein CLV63_13125 [Murinocardiopsis flavida]|uniref:ArsR family transcriptional regulator n=1 Tax=Murinocardiopsis flavida TaxID=645275 RepID=A0A2P8CR96_9ACTN|nr:hypothetical protein [Murinocardiopsis flavida]PSK87472.1 hypothetical protein CLV63_13125 [Murinocardiopsis flavida]
MLDVDVLKALGSEKRLAIMEWLRDPAAHFPPQRDGDLVEVVSGYGQWTHADRRMFGVSPHSLTE